VKLARGAAWLMAALAGPAALAPSARVLPSRPAPRASPLSVIPDSAGAPTRVLVAARAPDGTRWLGSYGRGIFVSRNGALRQIAHDNKNAASISWDFVHAIAFGAHGEVWYGTVGNGWGLSLDQGVTWKNWTFSQLGPEWQYVAPQGIVVRGDTVVIGTADGLQVTTDDGGHWTAIGDTTGPAAHGPADTAVEALDNEYVRSVSAGRDGWTIMSLRGGVVLNLHGCLVRAHGDALDRCLLRHVSKPGGVDEPIGLQRSTGAVPGSAKNWAPWFARPISRLDNDRPDQTYRWGSTMGGNFQPHQGIEFNNPDGTLVHAIGDGTVVYAGRAEQGALTVGIRHDTMLTVNGQRQFVFSVYYHNSALLVHVGSRVHRGEVIARVGHTGRATNDHVHLEVHVAPTDSVRPIIDSLNRYPAYSTNPELWITPIPGTGIVAGTVRDSTGAAIAQARIYGWVKPEPRETPLVYVETYGPRNRPHPLYAEQFAITDMPAGVQHLFAVVDGRRIERTVTVRPGAMTWVDFRP
jgi:hypothetical protein